MSYGKNSFKKYYENDDPKEMLKSFLSQNSTLNTSQSCSRLNTMLTSFQNEMKSKKVADKHSKLNKNVDVLNIRYIDTNSNFYFLAHQKRFDFITKYNAKAQNQYNDGMHLSISGWDKYYKLRKQLGIAAKKK